MKTNGKSQKKNLRDIYHANIDCIAQFVDSFKDEDLSGPLLLEPSTYFKQLKAYRDFNVGETYVASPFWNITRKVETVLGIDCYSCAWSNLNRFDHDGGPPAGKVLEEVAKLDFLLREEIQILNPDICLFYTNRKYDHRIEALYPGVQFHNIDGLPDGHFTQLTHEDLPSLSFRTPHPRTIRMQKWEESFISFCESFSKRTNT